MMISPMPGPAKAFGTVLIVDDHPLFCDALSITLRSAAGVTVTESADSLTTALDRIASGAIDLIVLDLNLPDVSGIDGLIQVRGAAPDVPVLVVSSITDNTVISHAIAAGANGFVPKHSAREVFAHAFEQIARGETVIPLGLTLDDTPTRTSQADAIARLSSLTRQQARILQLICEGKLNKQIAFELSIAEATVKAHVTAIMRKLGVHSRTQAVLLAREVSFNSLLHE